jgi:hypothetical protein
VGTDRRESLTVPPETTAIFYAEIMASPRKAEAVSIRGVASK